VDRPRRLRQGRARSGWLTSASGRGSRFRFRHFADPPPSARLRSTAGRDLALHALGSSRPAAAARAARQRRLAWTLGIGATAGQSATAGEYVCSEGQRAQREKGFLGAKRAAAVPRRPSPAAARRSPILPRGWATESGRPGNERKRSRSSRRTGRGISAPQQRRGRPACDGQAATERGTPWKRQSPAPPEGGGAGGGAATSTSFGASAAANEAGVRRPPFAVGRSGGEGGCGPQASSWAGPRGCARRATEAGRPIARRGRGSSGRFKRRVEALAGAGLHQTVSTCSSRAQASASRTRVREKMGPRQPPRSASGVLKGPPRPWGARRCRRRWPVAAGRRKRAGSRSRCAGQGFPPPSPIQELLGILKYQHAKIRSGRVRETNLGQTGGPGWPDASLNRPRPMGRECADAERIVQAGPAPDSGPHQTFQQEVETQRWSGGMDASMDGLGVAVGERGRARISSAGGRERGRWR